MPDLNALVEAAFANLVQQGGAPTEQALYDRLAADIQRQSGNTTQQALENTFGRGLGISTISRDIMDQIERARTDALMKARNDAFLGAQSAQLSALGQAAGVAQNQLNRNQQAGQFGEQMKLAKRGQDLAQSAANKQLLAQGLGLGVGGLAQVAGKTFGPEITGGLRRLFGLGSPTVAGGGAVPTAAAQNAPAMPDVSAIRDLTTGSSGLGFDPSSLVSSIPDLNFGTSFDLPAMSDLGSNLFDSGLFSLSDLAGLTDIGTSLANTGLYDLGNYTLY